ncbi:lipid II:glycine glycyltransferase FemX [Nocardioides limicola]|uniref:lipid II:glycine glycyltransferase FemX n=1 Tax=Nocardioides limicola TaxID=2803368 RepID=UPI00193BAE20|nr:peptidoglycan bridge formation glycyltransferase FemA/FemB family protein [Nocardioides sp. DJM-14]
MTPRLVVRAITKDEHLGFLTSRDSASFLQTPAWARVKAEWQAESLGWFRPDTGELAGVGLVLFRQLPKVKRYLAYLPEGPVIDWEDDELAPWLDPLAAHLKGKGAFGVRMGPPVVTRTWDAATIKAGLADESVRRLTELTPSHRNPAGARVVAELRRLGWLPQSVDDGFAAGQPQHNFWLRLTDAEGAALSGEQVLKLMNQQWRRNIKKATKEGVEVARIAGTEVDDADLAAFHELYVHTAGRDGFTPRPLSYFRTMLTSLGAEDPGRITLWLARHEGDLVAATISIRVGTHAWYSYGASSTEKREVRGSNAVQWAMISDALAAGARIYDLRGITDTVNAEDPHAGLIQFKVGTGGEAVEYAGEWDLPLRKSLYRAFQWYLRRRG